MLLDNILARDLVICPVVCSKRIMNKNKCVSDGQCSVVSVQWSKNHQFDFPAHFQMAASR